jgi:alpha-L-rhamnosidase
VGDWLYRVVAGVELDPSQPAYKHFLLGPRPGGSLTSARGTHLSPYGEITSAWRKGQGSFDWDVVVPPNTTATARLPIPQNARLTESGGPVEAAGGVSQIHEGPDAVTCELVSGVYHFKATWQE